MAKKCIICDEAEAIYCIKGTSDFYCEACAIDNFGDIALLVKVEDEAQRLKGVIRGRIAEKEEHERERKEE